MMQTQLRAGSASESNHGVKLFNISTDELVAAMRNAVRGYQIYQHSREFEILYREICLGNILTAESTKDREHMAWLWYDFEYGSKAKGMLVPNKLYDLSKHDPFLPVAEDYDHHDEGEERIGTYYFFAIELLRDPSVVHTIHHDLESFYWVLLWVALRYTAHDRDFTEDPRKNIFEFGSDEKAEYAKFGWLGTTRQFTVKGDAPLTDLLRQFKAFCKRAILDSGARLTHNDVVGILNGALARKDWPTNPLRG